MSCTSLKQKSGIALKLVDNLRDRYIKKQISIDELDSQKKYDLKIEKEDGWSIFYGRMKEEISSLLKDFSDLDAYIAEVRA